MFLKAAFNQAVVNSYVRPKKLLLSIQTSHVERSSDLCPQHWTVCCFCCCLSLYFSGTAQGYVHAVGTPCTYFQSTASRARLWTQLYNHCRIMAENSVKYVSPDCFFGIQILQNSVSVGAVPRTPLGELTTLPQTP